MLPVHLPCTFSREEHRDVLDESPDEIHEMPGVGGCSFQASEIQYFDVLGTVLYTTFLAKNQGKYTQNPRFSGVLWTSESRIMF